MSSGPASRLTGMETERVTASTTIEAAPEAVFAVLADPSAHADIDGTGWVRGSVDGDRITAAGQVFRMAMYHENHPDKDYKIANRVEVFDEPRAIAWQPGTESPETGELSFGGWIWRYDLEATGPSRTTVTLTYDWSAVPPQVREYLQFPPFGQDHLDNSLQHLSDLFAGEGAGMAVAPPGGWCHFRARGGGGLWARPGGERPDRRAPSLPPPSFSLPGGGGLDPGFGPRR